MLSSRNPELQKNIWLELNPRRLVLMPLLLGGIFLAVGLASDSSSDFARSAWIYALVLYGFLVLLWGTKMASEAVVGEVNQRTWDSQRLTLLSPWQLTVGKLLGSTLYAWYGGLLCLLVFCLTYPNFSYRGQGFKITLVMILIGLFAHALTLLLSLVGLAKNRHRGRLQSTFYFLIGVAGSLVLLNTAWPNLVAWDNTISWFFFAIPLDNFTALSAIFFSTWALVGLHRSMRGEMHWTNGPWAWWLFGASTALYAAGFAALAPVSAMESIALGCYIALIVTGALTYYTAFSEVKDPVHARRLSEYFSRRQWGPFFAQAPLWLLSLALAIPCGLLGLAAGLGADGSFMNEIKTPLWSLNALFFLLRDLSLLFYFNLAADNKRADLAALIALLTLYGLLPVIVGVSTSTDLLPALLPIPTHNLVLGTLLPLAQFAAAFALFRSRFKQLLQSGIEQS